MPPSNSRAPTRDGLVGGSYTYSKSREEFAIAAGAYTTDIYSIYRRLETSMGKEGYPGRRSFGFSGSVLRFDSVDPDYGRLEIPRQYPGFKQR